MFFALVFFVTQKPEEIFYSIGFGSIGVAYLGAFFYLKTRKENGYCYFEEVSFYNFFNFIKLAGDSLKIGVPLQTFKNEALI